MEKYWFAVIAVVILAILGIIFINKNHEEFAAVPNIKIEAQVISLNLTDLSQLEAYNLRQSDIKDSALVKINKLVSKSVFDWQSLGIEQGSEISVDFLYSARKAKLVRDADAVSQNLEADDAVSYSAKPVLIQEDYLVYQLPVEEDKTLPGLNPGDKFRATAWFGMNDAYSFTINEYELI